jgi:hypothetical protein
VYFKEYKGHGNSLGLTHRKLYIYLGLKHGIFSKEYNGEAHNI